MNSGSIDSIPSEERETLLKLALQAGLERVPSNTIEISSVSRDKLVPLSFAQQRMWFLSQLDETGTSYHVDDGVRLDGNLNRVAFKWALDALLARHGSLRTRFSLVNGKPMQWLDVGTQDFTLFEEDLRGSHDPHKALSAAVRRNANERFDLERGPLVRGLLLHISDKSYVFVMTLHHIVCDGWSMGILIRDLTELYEARVHECESNLPKLPIDYIDYAVWQRDTYDGEVIRRKLTYWTKKLAGAPGLLLLPTDRRRTSQCDSEGASFAISFDATLVQKLRDLSTQRSMTLYMTMLAAWAITLARVSGERDFVIAVPVSNRTSVAVESVVGFFTNTLAIRFDFRACGTDVTVDEILRLIRRQLLEAHQNQDVPFEQVVEAVQPPRHEGHAPLLQLMFAWQVKSQEAQRESTLAIRPFESNHRSRDSEITVSIGDLGDTVGGHIAYSVELYDRTTIYSFVEAWQCVLKSIADDVSLSVKDLPLMTDATWKQILLDWNPTHETISRPDANDLVHKRLEAIAHTAPNAIALVQGDKVVRYGQLNSLADRLARRLIPLGVGPDVLVAIAAHKSIATIVGMLAILKAGGAYLAIDTAWSRVALTRAITVSLPKLILVDEVGREALVNIGTDIPLLELDDCDEASQDPLGGATQISINATSIHPRNLAYAICTSGSTGSPKIVMVEHLNLASLIRWHEKEFALKPGQRMSCLANLGFDASVWEIWSVLCAGAELHLPPLQAKAQTLDELLAWWCEQEIDASFLPTPVAEYAFSRGIVHPTLQMLFVGGDRLRMPSMAGSVDTLVDLYGTSETTVVSIAGRVDPQRTRASLGRPTSHTAVYVLDAQGLPMPLGIPGEIYLGGRCVSRGYMRDPKQSAARFVPDPFSKEVGGRLYKTGDTGRWLQDGTIEFLGRRDHEVKVGGVRIELSAIETCLCDHPLVRESIVIARDDDTTLVAYVLAEQGSSKPEAGILRAYLAAHLPSYLIPRAFVTLDAWPLSANGKLDRTALPKPSSTIIPPIGIYETTIGRHWCSLLKLPAVSREDDFFELGGHSLLCAQMNHHIFLEFGVDVGIRNIYELRTLKNISDRVAILTREMEDQSFRRNSPAGSLEI